MLDNKLISDAIRELPLFSSAQLSAVLKTLPDPAFILTRSGRYAAIFGGSDLRYYHESSGLVGKYMRDVLCDDKANWFLRQIALALAARSLHVVEYALAAADVQGLPAGGPQDTIWYEGRVQALGFQVDGEDAVLWVASNVTARKALEDLLRRQSETDALSGLFNRRKLMETLRQHFDLYVRYGTPTAVLIFDIDNFKRINDVYGHLAGDTAIATTAEVCRTELRATDFPTRLGGDEFVVLMPHTTLAQAAPIAERLRLHVAQALKALGTLDEGTTISGGLSELLPGDVGDEDVLKRADGALYQAKHDGRNRVVHA